VAIYGRFGLQSHRKEIDLNNECVLLDLFCDWKRQKLLPVRQLAGQIWVKMDLKTGREEKECIGLVYIIAPWWSYVEEDNKKSS
jgi:hypothetical protein